MLSHCLHRLDSLLNSLLILFDFLLYLVRVNVRAAAALQKLIFDIEIFHVCYNVAVDKSEPLVIIIGWVHVVQHVHLLFIHEIAELWIDELVQRVIFQCLLK